MAYYRRRYRSRYGYYRSTGGTIAGLAGILSILLILSFYIIVVGVETTADVFGVLLGDGAIYDEEILQEYADEQYAAEFAASPALEDNLLIVILVEPDCQEYHYYARVGSHVAPELAELYAHNDSAFSRAIYEAVEQGSYENSLSGDLVNLLSRMDDATWEAYDDRLVICQETSTNDDRLINRTDLELRVGTINRQLKKTTFSTVLLVEDMREVYGYHIPLKELLIAITTLLAVAGIVLRVIRLFRRSSVGEEKTPEGGRRQEGTDYIEQLDDDHWEDRY
ncbi:MAG: hypothetical protein IJX76_05155 [Clostridia bacterium]|nr:hypothetical protein [Clostridia bacterium]